MNNLIPFSSIKKKLVSLPSQIPKENPFIKSDFIVYLMAAALLVYVFSKIMINLEMKLKPHDLETQFMGRLHLQNNDSFWATLALFFIPLYAIMRKFFLNRNL